MPIHAILSKTNTGFVPQRRPAIKAALAAGLLALSACITTSPDDGKLTAELRAEVYKHPALRGDFLSLQVIDHVAYLNGTVTTMLEHYVAGDIAAKIPGVVKVVNSTHEPLQY